MRTVTQPSKETIRDWLHRRLRNNHPLPDIEQIRRELGWRSIAPQVDANKFSIK